MDTRVHISLEVRDLEASIKFYQQLFQREPTKVKSDYANFRMDAPSLHLALVHRPGRAPEPADGSRHFGIELFDDERLSGWLETVKQATLEPRIEEQVTCCYAVANKFWVRDPDGHEWEFWVRKEEAEQMRDAGAEACCASTPGPDTEQTGSTTTQACCAPATSARMGQATSEGATSCCMPGLVQVGGRRA
jgi:catechol 2,3-dioxygenase-like lactoylglutathione lyase family enzyme